MTERETPDAGGAGGFGKRYQPRGLPQKSPKNQLAIDAIRHALDVVDAIGEPGHVTAGGLAANLGDILEARLDRSERMLIAGAGVLSLDVPDRHALADAALEGEPLGATIERRRQAWLARWARERGARP